MELRHANTAGLLQQIRDRICGIGQFPAGEPPSQAGKNTLFQLQRASELVQRCRESAAAIGSIPPAPNTFRARIGGYLVRLVHRALFWYTPQIANHNSLVAETLAENVQILRRASAQIAAAIEAASNTMSDRMDAVESLIREVASAQQDLAGRLTALERETASIRQDLAGRLTALEREAASIREELPGRLTALEQRGDHIEHNLLRSAGHRLEQVERAVVQLRREITIQQTGFAARIADPPSGPRPETAAREIDHSWDPFYAGLEDAFRGTYQEIKDRLSVYLPRLRVAGAGSPEAPVLDIGCGRGEWLELLREHGLEGTGVDLNRVFVRECLDRKLPVTEGDAVSFLRTLPDGSLGAITMFHVVEHLSLESLLTILDETVRVLRPGGIAILETPNPANVTVGTHNFYYDPTHRNPVPSALLSFLAEARGLHRVEVLPLHPFSAGYLLRDDGSELVRRFNEYFYGPQDYAVIGYKL